MQELDETARVALCIWLGAAGLAKLADTQNFARAVRHYRVLPPRLAKVYAMAAPLAEVVISVQLFVGLLVGVAGWLAMLLFLSFGVGVGINLRRGRNLDCHCFGPRLPMRIGWHTLVVDGLLVVAALVLSLDAPDDIARLVKGDWSLASPPAV
jgi:uncharacterized membrane protein YphA (DoxX/SURF4 family)